MQHLLPIFLLLAATLFASCRSSRHMVEEATTTADTLHTTLTTQHTTHTAVTTADTTAVSTHTSTFAYLIERTVVDSLGNVQHRTLERGTFTSRRADTTATAHRAASTITADTTTIRTACASRSSSTTTTQTASAHSLRDKFTALLMLALIVAVCVGGGKMWRKIKA